MDIPKGLAKRIPVAVNPQVPCDRDNPGMRMICYYPFRWKPTRSGGIL